MQAHAVVYLAVALVLAFAGCSGGEEGAGTVSRESPAAETETGAVDTATDTSGGEEPSADGVRFRGNGDARLPPFRVARGGAVLHWMNRGEVFSLFTDDSTVVDSVEARGEARLPAGVYRIDVIASGRWVVTIPGARRVG